MDDYEDDSSLIERLRNQPLPGDAPSVDEIMYRCGYAAGLKQSQGRSTTRAYSSRALAAALLVIGFVIGRWEYRSSQQHEPVQLSGVDQSSDSLWLQLNSASKGPADTSQHITLLGHLNKPTHKPIEDVASSQLPWAEDIDSHFRMTPRGALPRPDFLTNN